MAYEKCTKIDLSWIAGIFEGEGSICVYKGAGEKTKYVRLFFFNNDITMLEEVQRLIGGHLHIRTHKRKDEWAESHQLQLGKKEDIILFKNYVVPYFRTKYKKEQFEKAIELANKNGGEY
jgi:hypothetical protein